METVKIFYLNLTKNILTFSVMRGTILLCVKVHAINRAKGGCLMDTDTLGSNCVVGFKQVTRGLKSDLFSQVFIALDADKHIKTLIEEEASKNSVDVVYVNTKEELGKLCGIEINAAAAALLK